MVRYGLVKGYLNKCTFSVTHQFSLWLAVSKKIYVIWLQLHVYLH